MRQNSRVRWLQQQRDAETEREQGPPRVNPVMAEVAESSMLPSDWPRKRGSHRPREGGSRFLPQLTRGRDRMIGGQGSLVTCQY